MTFGKHPAQTDPDFYGQLRCKCGSDYLHQINTTIFHRAEDAKITTVIAQSGDTVQASNFPSDDTCNPSPRRQGMIVEFDCEDCGGDGKLQQLAIYQHKGNTFMEWL